MNTTRTLCFVIAALSSYAALVYRLCQVRRNWRDSAYRTLVVTLLLQCLTFTMGAVAMGGDSFLGVGNLAILVMHVSAVAFCVSAQIILLRWATATEETVRRARYWLVTGVAVCALLIVLFLVADGPAGRRRTSTRAAASRWSSSTSWSSSCPRRFRASPSSVSAARTRGWRTRPRCARPCACSPSRR